MLVAVARARLAARERKADDVPFLFRDEGKTALEDLVHLGELLLDRDAVPGSVRRLVEEVAVQAV